MKGITLGIGALVIAVVLSACSGLPSATTLTTYGNPTVVDTPMVTGTPDQMSGTDAPLPTAQTSLDPCQLVTSPEASALAGTTYGPGREDTTSGGGRTCTYGYQTTNVFMVIVAQAPDVATAQAAKAQFINDLESKLPQIAQTPMKVTQLPNFADGAVTATLSVNIGAQTLNGISIGVLKGTVFFGFSDLVLGSAAPSLSAMESQAQTVLGRL